MAILDNIIADIRQIETSTRSDSTESILWSLSAANRLPGLRNGTNEWLLPTHTAWGKDNVSNAIKESQDKILATITDIIGSAKTIADVSSLAKVADGKFRAAIIEGARRAYEAGNRPLIRLLWGKTIFMSALSGDYRAIDKLIEDIKRVAPGLPVVAALTNFEEIGHEKSWNHSKIVAADGRTAMVGGMNLWSDDYMKEGSTVTDLSIRVEGDAARGAQQFLNEIWSYVQQKGSSSKYPRLSLSLNPTYAVSANIAGKQYIRPIPDGIDSDVSRSPLPILSVGRAGWLRNGRITRATDNSIRKELTTFATGWLWDAVGAGGVMNEGNPQWDANNPSDTALRSLISNAEKEITISQQMLDFKVVSIGKPVFDLRLFEAIADRIIDGVDIDIITSNLNVEGDYSASNPQDSWNAIAALIYRGLQKSSDMIRASEDQIETKALSLINENLSIKALRVSEQETWPGKAKNPGLHSKIIAVDDEAFYIGSQNAYPNQLLEFGYIIEDKKATIALGDQYLDPMNDYSKPFAIKRHTGFRSLLPKSAYLEGGTGDGYFNAGDGNDRVIGGRGDDMIRGGLGADILTGQQGRDTFIYLSERESPASEKSRDVITDFNPSEDLIDLTDLCQHDTTAGPRFVGSEAFSGRRDEIRVQQRSGGLLLQLDCGGDKVSDLEIVLAGLDASALLAPALISVDLA